MSTKTYRYVLVEEDGRSVTWPSRDEIARVLSEMDRYGPNRGWVLGKALARARAGLKS